MADDETTIETRGLDQILKALKAKPPVARVGILGGNARTDGESNATIGACHEFGTTKMPQRSFLRVPLTEHLDKAMQSSNAFDKETLKEVIKSGTVIPWITKVAILAENIVFEAFSSNGFGKWAPWKGSYTSKTGNILVDTQQLRNSITYDVKA